MKILAWCRERPWTWAVAAGGAGVVCGAAGGYYLGPTKVETRTVTEWRERIVEREVEKIVRVEGPVRIKRVIVERPVPGSCDTAGPVVMETVTTEDEERGPVTTTTDETHDRELEALGVTATEKIVSRDAPRLTLAATAGMPFKGGTFDVGVLVLGRVWGPLVIGGQVEVPITGAVTEGSARLVLGLTF